MENNNIYDCIIIGAGTGGLQAAIYLARYNRDVLVLDRGGGRTLLALTVENFLSHRAISGKEIIDTGIEQAIHFGAKFEKERVTKVIKKDNLTFEVYSKNSKFVGRSVLVATGVLDNLPNIKNLHKFFGRSFLTCIDRDGYRTIGKTTVVIGNSIKAAHTAFTVHHLFTEDMKVICVDFELPDVYKTIFDEDNVPVITGTPAELIGDNRLEGIKLADGRIIKCETILSNFGYITNDDFLSELNLKKDSNNKYHTNRNYESSEGGLYIIGPLMSGNDQIVIVAGQGAIAAVDINKRLLDMGI